MVVVALWEKKQTLHEAQLFYIKGDKNPSLWGNRTQLCKTLLLAPAIKSSSWWEIHNVARASRITPWQGHPYSAPQQQNWASLLFKAALTHHCGKIKCFFKAYLPGQRWTEGLARNLDPMFSALTMSQEDWMVFSLQLSERTKPKVQMFLFNIIISLPCNYNTR